MLFNCSVCTLPMTVQHLKKAMGERLKNSRKLAQGWGKMGKNGEKWGKNFMGKAFYDWQFSPFFSIFPHWLPLGNNIPTASSKHQNNRLHIYHYHEHSRMLLNTLHTNWRHICTCQQTETRTYTSSDTVHPAALCSVQSRRLSSVRCCSPR